MVGVGARRVGEVVSELGVRGDSGLGLVFGVSGGGGFHLYRLCLSVSCVGSNCSRNCYCIGGAMMLHLVFVACWVSGCMVLFRRLWIGRCCCFQVVLQSLYVCSGIWVSGRGGHYCL